MNKTNEEERKNVLKLLGDYLRKGNKTQLKLYENINPEIMSLLADKVLTSAFLKMMCDYDLVSCAIMMFENNLNISETSRNAFLHRNTLVYRIEKIQKLSGLNIKNFEDAFTLKLLMVLYYEKNRNE
ncbi:MAG: helix-turn-helix domain-containing protein [Clostridia bacterium]|nr:helix-turn-helix domain-containing protein [Clostridia bacterium]